MLIPAEKVVIQALDHETRRTILRLLQARAFSFSELMKLLDVPSGQLNYHLSQIAGLIRKNEKNGKWESTILGVKAVNFLDLLEQQLTDKEIPFLCEAYISQMTGKENIQQFHQSYLEARLQAVDLIQGLLTYLEKKEEAQNLPNFLFQINRKILSLREKYQKKPPSLEFFQGAYDTINQAEVQLRKDTLIFPYFLSRMKTEAIGLLSQLGLKDFDLATSSTPTKISEDLTEEFSRFETEG